MFAYMNAANTYYIKCMNDHEQQKRRPSAR